jgi:hypothetical protein
MVPLSGFIRQEVCYLTGLNQIYLVLPRKVGRIEGPRSQLVSIRKSKISARSCQHSAVSTQPRFLCVSLKADCWSLMALIRKL